MEVTSRRLASDLSTRGPFKRKAIILRLSGFTMGVAMYPIELPVWTLRTGVLIIREFVTNIMIIL